jgi:hypothetical protein
MVESRFYGALRFRLITIAVSILTKNPVKKPNPAIKTKYSTRKTLVGTSTVPKNRPLKKAPR